MTFKRRTIIAGMNIGWIVIIFLLCCIPGDRLPSTDLEIPHLDKAVHFGMFYILSLLNLYPIERYTRMSRISACATVILCTAVYGGCIEYLQQHFFARSGDLYDLVADISGAVAACISYPKVRWIFIRLF